MMFREISTFYLLPDDGMLILYDYTCRKGYTCLIIFDYSTQPWNIPHFTSMISDDYLAMVYGFHSQRDMSYPQNNTLRATLWQSLHNELEDHHAMKDWERARPPGDVGTTRGLLVSWGNGR